MKRRRKVKHQHKPIIRFKPNCGHVGDEESDDYDYADVEGTTKKPLVTSLTPTYPPSSEEPTAAPHTQPALTSASPPLSIPAGPSLTLAAFLTTPAHTTASSTAPPASTSPAITLPSAVHPSQPPSTAPFYTAPPSTQHSPTISLTAAPSTSSHAQSTLTTRAASSPLTTSTGAFSTSPSALPSPTKPESTSITTSPPSALTSPTLVVPNTTLSAHTPTLSAPLDTTRSPRPSPPLPPPLLCPCSTPAQTPSVLHSQAAVKDLHWEHWVLSHCCLLRWVLYLACLALLLLSVLLLACCLVWTCLTKHNSLQTQEVQHPLLRWGNSTQSHTTDLCIFRSSQQRSTFCTTKEIELCPEVATSHTYCTIKDLGVQRGPPAKSFCTTKELWIHHGPLNAPSNPFPTELTATKLSSQSPSAHSLDRGVRAIGAVRVKHAANTL
ncbi:mucin-2-like [Phasianus colchicus]|uniref:mucin-2-like n=1 Tax=Phasianus colchicus TaxID=9054 RepID=UPI00129D33FA|nr:mucin-2-like [Phasianus colchicus]